MEQSLDRKSIAIRSSDVRQSLLDLLNRARRTGAPLELHQVEDVLDRFKLWTGNLGALHQPNKRMSLESRLADSPEIQDQICEQLDDMQEAVQDLLALCSESYVDIEANTEDARDSPASADAVEYDLVRDTESTSRDEEADSILRMVSECLKALFRIGILVRKATPRDRFERALQKSEYAFAAQFDINYVEERYPKLAFKDSSWLASRLGNANSKRRQFMNYAREHRTKLQVEDINPAADAATTKQSSKATTFVVPGNIPTSEFLQSPLEEDDDSVSLVSTSTAFDNETSLRLPSLADLGPDGEYFECPICFTLQSFRREKAWKLHAYRDLKAYICTSSAQECKHKMFSDRDTWFNHELNHHHSLHVCKLCGCQYRATKLLEQHITNEHGPYSNDEFESLVEHGKLVPSQLNARDCPFCDGWASILSQRRHRTDVRASSSIEQEDILVSLTHFKRHVATHQEQLAIFTVPRMVDDDEKRSHDTSDSNSGAFSTQDGNSQVNDKEAHTIGESTAYELSSTCVHLSGLPPHIRNADITRHFGLGESTKIADIKLFDGFGFIDFHDPNDAQRAVKSFNWQEIMGMPIKVEFARVSRDPETGKMRVGEALYADSFEPAREIQDSDAQDSRIRTTVSSMCEELIANPPSDTQKWQDQYNSILGMVPKEVELMTNDYMARDDLEAVPGRTEVARTMSAILYDSPPLAMVRKRHEAMKARESNEGRIHRPTDDRWYAKVYKLSGNDWQDQRTGYCTVKLVRTTFGRNVAHVIVNSEVEPGHLIIVHEGDDFRQQQETLIVWTEGRTGIDMALSFQEPAGCDTIWKVIDSVQRGVGKDPDAIEESQRRFMKQKLPFSARYFTSAILEKELDRTLGKEGWGWAKERWNHQQEVYVARQLTKDEIESIEEKMRTFCQTSLGEDSRDVDTHSPSNTANLHWQDIMDLRRELEGNLEPPELVEPVSDTLSLKQHDIRPRSPRASKQSTAEEDIEEKDLEDEVFISRRDLKRFHAFSLNYFQDNQEEREHDAAIEADVTAIPDVIKPTVEGSLPRAEDAPATSSDVLEPDPGEGKKLAKGFLEEWDFETHF